MKLSQAVDLYIQRKRDAGMRFDSPTKHTALVSSTLWRHRSSPHHRPASHRIPRRLGRNAQHLERQTRHAANFFRLLDSTRSAEILSAAACAPKTTQSFVPYIYSRSDLRSLLDAVPRCQRRSACVMSEATFRTLLLFLYATGMRLGEALRLRLMDVDLPLGLVTIRDTKFYKSRLVPLGPDLAKLIRQYLHQPGRRNQHYRPLFQTKSANPIAAPGCWNKLLALATNRAHRASRRFVLPTDGFMICDTHSRFTD